jgi:pyruvate/2-oxoglutarate dehydrogenase complex dihydrolipoamide dehydrogenase (E3) component
MTQYDYVVIGAGSASVDWSADVLYFKLKLTFKKLSFSRNYVYNR